MCYHMYYYFFQEIPIIPTSAKSIEKFLKFSRLSTLRNNVTSPYLRVHNDEA